MMKILILDDDESKISEIRDVIVDGCGLDDSCITAVGSQFACSKELRESYYDLLILDLVVPLKDDEEPDKYEGPKFIRQLYNENLANIPNEILGLSSFDEIAEKVKTDFEDRLWYLLKYEKSSNDWKNKLKAKILHIQRVKENKKTMENENQYDIAIVCALRKEFNQLIIAFGEDKWKKVKVEGLPCSCMTLDITTSIGNQLRIIACDIDSPGMVPATCVVTYLFSKVCSKYVIMTGFAAGTKPEGMEFGDVVVAESIQDYSAGAMVEDGNGNVEHQKEIKQYQGCRDLIAIAQELCNSVELMGRLNENLRKSNLLDDRTNVKAKVSPTICGPYVVKSEKLVEEYTEASRKVAALDMEGYGIYLTAHYLEKKVLWVKGVADYARPGKSNDYQKLASFASAYFVYLMIKELM